MDRITDAFAWPLRDPHWAGKLALVGLILLIPIVGAVNGLGWMLTALDRLREGETSMPAANFSYLGRGLRLFVVELVYAAVIALVGVAVYVPAVLVLMHEGSGPANAGLISLGVILSVLAFSLITLGFLALNFATPAIVLETDRGGIRAGLHVGRIVRRLRVSVISALTAGLMLIAAGFIGSLGGFVCGVGIVLTTAYSLAIQAWIVRSFEQGPAAATPA